MLYCIHNSITTPDGTVLRCIHRHDYKTHTDKVSGEFYMNDGLGYYTRRSSNEVPYVDNSVWIDETKQYNFNNQPDLEAWESLRKISFWGTRGVDGKQKIKYISLAETTDQHLSAILETQTLSYALIYFFGVEESYRCYLKVTEVKE